MSVPKQHFHQQLQPTRPFDINRYCEMLSNLMEDEESIKRMSELAGSNRAQADLIVNAIEGEMRRRIKTKHPNKLPIIYLIDNICKRQGGDYITKFGRIITDLFVDAYKLSDPVTKGRFERCLKTWRTGIKPQNSAHARYIPPIFSRQILDELERRIGLPMQRQPHQQHQPHQPHQPQQQNGPPSDPRGRPVAPVAQNGHSRSSPVMTHPTSTGTPPLPQVTNQIDVISQTLRQIQNLLPTLPPDQASAVQMTIQQLVSQQSTPPPVRLSHPDPPVQPAVETHTGDALSKLAMIGLFNPPRQSPAPSNPPANIESTKPFRLDGKDLQIPRPGAVEVLYSKLTRQCKQCGFRYPEDDQEKINAHLDAHHRQNRKMKEKMKRGTSRTMFISEDDWIDGNDTNDPSQFPTMPEEDHRRDQATGDSVSNADKLMLAEQHTVPKIEGGAGQCPICYEKFVEFWDDEEEEWLYKNAIEVDNTICHYTCHSESVERANMNTVGLSVGDSHEEGGVKRKVDSSDEFDVKARRIEPDVKH